MIPSESDRDKPRGVEATRARQDNQPQTITSPFRRMQQRRVRHCQDGAEKVWQAAAFGTTRRRKRGRPGGFIGTVWRGSGGRTGGGAAAALRRLSTMHRQAVRNQSAKTGQKVKRARLRIMVKQAGAMCTEQRIDYLAACDGKITWARYFAKWRLSL